MSSRALRKAQREREAQEQLNKLSQEHEEQDEDEHADGVITQSPKQSAFALLGAKEDNEDDDEGVNLDSEDVETQLQEPAISSVPKTTAKKKKKKSKKKARAADSNTPSAAVTEDEELDEIDKALKQLSTNGNSSLPGSTIGGIDPATDESSKLLAINTNYLHAQNEMRRLFGSAVLEADDDADGQPAQGRNRREQRWMQHVGLVQGRRGYGGLPGGRAGGPAAMALRRNIFIQGKEEWPVATSGGLAMEVEEKRADGTVLFRFTHNRVYQDVQRQFAIAVESMDPQRLIVLLQHNPYHISTLLQVSEIAKQDRDHSTSGDLLERALFSFGKTVHSTFAKQLADGKARLDFARPENREFWLASWRYMQNLSMRATWRTVYEWAKLLLSLAPEEDPYGMWLVLDQYALRARQDLDYLNLSRNPTLKSVHGNMPNVQLSQGLAEFRAGNPGKGKQVLFTAIGRFPWVVARLMQELSVDPLPPAIWGKEPRSETERLYAEVYATRAKDLWNTPETSALLVEVASALPPDTPAASVDESEIQENVARHVLLSDAPALIALIPRHYTNALRSSSDPLLPANSYPSYFSNPNDDLVAEASSAALELDELGEHYRFFTTHQPSRYGISTGEEQEPQLNITEQMALMTRETGYPQEFLLLRTQQMLSLHQRLAVDGGLEISPEIQSGVEQWRALYERALLPGDDGTPEYLRPLGGDAQASEDAAD